MLAALKKPPPKLYFPSFVNLDGFLARFKEAQRKEGFGRAYNKTRMESTLRKGTLVGSDYNGNKYYEDRDAPYGRTRWVEYPTPPGVWAIEQKYDGSMVRTSNLFVLPNAYPLRAPRALPPPPTHAPPPPPPCAPPPSRPIARARDADPAFLRMFVAGEPRVARLAALHARQDGRAAGGRA